MTRESKAKERPQSLTVAGSRYFIKYNLAACVSLITFLVYIASLFNGFVNWDDPLYVTDNPHIQSLNFPFLKWAFFDFYFHLFIPLTWISLAFDAVWGMSAVGFHLTNNILHAVNTFLVAVLVMRLVDVWKGKTTETGMTGFLNEQSTLITGGVAGLLFGLHPLHVESVAWVSERKDVLCAMFFLLSVMMYTKYALIRDAGTVRETKSHFLNKLYLLSIGFYILALLSKPMAISLPAVLLILDWHPFKRIRSVRLFALAFVEKLPFIVLSLIDVMLNMHEVKGWKPLTIPTLLSGRLLVAFKSIIVYLWKMVLPLNLIPYYPYPKNIAPFSKEYLFSIILVIVITVVCFIMAKKQKLFLSVWGYYVLTLVPVLGIVPLAGASMADRYTYLPSIGPFLLIGLSAAYFGAHIIAPSVLR